MTRVLQSGSAAPPTTQPHERDGHRCGRCANPFTRSGGRDDCPNARRGDR